jgi:hypothetical protein
MTTNGTSKKVVIVAQKRLIGELQNEICVPLILTGS